MNIETATGNQSNRGVAGSNCFSADDYIGGGMVRVPFSGTSHYNRR
jgi:hypothetical protein